jgi:ribosomal-protein-alanine N-acetyltransferase
VLALLVGKRGVEKALKGRVLDALTLDANYVRPSYVEASKKRTPEAPAVQSVKANSEFLIRNYAPADSEQVLAICASAPEAAQWSKASYDQASGQMVLVAETSGEVCGFLVARVVGDEAEVLNMAVEGRYRRKKLGSQLLMAALKETRSRSAQLAMRVFLEVRESNVAGIAFYEKHGFCKKGKRAGYYRDPTEDAVLMEKKVTD